MTRPARRRFSRAAIAVTIGATAAVACNSSEEPSAMTTGTPPVSASRLPPPDVAAVVIDGVTYRPMAGSLDPDIGQIGGLLGAYGADGKRLWWLKVYDNRRRADLEGDVQDVFFASMTRDAGGLLIIDESGRRFHVDVAARRSTPLPPAPRSAPAAAPGLSPD